MQAHYINPNIVRHHKDDILSLIFYVLMTVVFGKMCGIHLTLIKILFSNDWEQKTTTTKSLLNKVFPVCQWFTLICFCFVSYESQLVLRNHRIYLRKCISIKRKREKIPNPKAKQKPIWKLCNFWADLFILWLVYATKGVKQPTHRKW